MENLTRQTPKFNVIYADPPWSFNNQYAAKVRKHYPLMSTKDIRSLPVVELAAKDCALFLWVVPSCLPDALHVMEAWGFKFKTVVFVWVKPCRTRAKLFLGGGHWTRSNSELCLLGLRGHPKRKSMKVPQVIIEPRREHSRKPDVARNRIVQLMGDLPRVELFARQHIEGWECWGNQIESTITLEANA
ncbi:MAG: MT-A70 family methyltransferase [Candidatus Bathyarchaeota archaeon]|nr:MT-A70 family methyltransferase [Candidatus Termiticorpusculum sp.]